MIICALSSWFRVGLHGQSNTDVVCQMRVAVSLFLRSSKMAICHVWFEVQHMSCMALTDLLLKANFRTGVIASLSEHAPISMLTKWLLRVDCPFCWGLLNIWNQFVVAGRGHNLHNLITHNYHHPIPIDLYLQINNLILHHHCLKEFRLCYVLWYFRAFYSRWIFDC